MRARPAVVAVVALLSLPALAACSGDRRSTTVTAQRAVTRSGSTGVPDPSLAAGADLPSDSPSPEPTPDRSVSPAASAGGVCRRLSYSMVLGTLAVRFDIAASSGAAGAAQVCVLQRIGASQPSLTFSVIPVQATTDAAAFKLDFQPRTAKDVTGLARAGYSEVNPAGSGGGPTVEVGWLGTNAVYTLSYTATRTTSPARAANSVPRLVSLARRVTR